jgi:serine/threonine-protein kinase RsbW
MKHSAQSDCEMRAEFPATLQAIEDFFVEFKRKSRAMPDPSICFAVELLVREALTNAVMHGCHADPTKQVRCSLRLKNRRMLIAVEDDGDGFDWRAAQRTAAAPLGCSGRGMAILLKYANRVRFNARGNKVTMIKRFDKDNQ